ncbi:MAG: hypothetical protein WC732_00085 [Candidatus Omnitrophota bacterium]
MVMVVKRVGLVLIMLGLLGLQSPVLWAQENEELRVPNAAQETPQVLQEVTGEAVVNEEVPAPAPQPPLTEEQTIQPPAPVPATPQAPAAPPAETPGPKQPVEPPAPPPAPYMEIKDVEAPSEWVWGEVVAVDEAARAITIKHLDYDTYEEVQKVLTVTDKTLFENAGDIKDIKPQDHITADYRTNGTINEIEMIVVDKMETSPVETQPVPAAAQPAESQESAGLAQPPAVPEDTIVVLEEDAAGQQEVVEEQPLVSEPAVTDVNEETGNAL